MYKGKISVNVKKKKLHKADCYCININGDGFITFQSLSTALLNCPFGLSACERCLADDFELKEKLEEHNQKHKRNGRKK